MLDLPAALPTAAAPSEAVMLKNLFYASASILMLALAYYLGASTATAQAPGNPIVAAGNGHVYSANGDDYIEQGAGTYIRLGNVFSGPPPAAQRTWGRLKAQYRK